MRYSNQRDVIRPESASSRHFSTMKNMANITGRRRRLKSVIVRRAVDKRLQLIVYKPHRIEVRVPPHRRIELVSQAIVGVQKF